MNVQRSTDATRGNNSDSIRTEYQSDKIESNQIYLIVNIDQMM